MPYSLAFHITVSLFIAYYLGEKTENSQVKSNFIVNTAIKRSISNKPAIALIDSDSTLKSVTSFPVGAAPGSWLPKKSAKGFQMLADEFNSKTVHAYINIETSPGKYDFSEPDYWVEWSETHSVRLHGHCLVYQGAAPDWILHFKGSKYEFEHIIKAHIQTIVGRYKGKIQSWDVVN